MMTFVFQKNSLNSHKILLTVLLLINHLTFSQVTIGFQGGEPGDTWGFNSTGASALATSEATMNPNKVTGTTSLVVGGNTGGGNCFDTGSGNGPNVARTFTFNSLDITNSSNSIRTLTFNWGNRYPMCSGTGWDSGENLVFRAYHDGIAQPPVTLATGINNAQFSIHSNQYTWNVPVCVTSFYFVLSITTNRADELLFIDDVRLTAPSLNGTLSQPQIIAGNTTICEGMSQTYGVVQENGVVYTWSGLPTGATFITTNGTVNSHTMTVDWGTVPQGNYTLTITPSTACGGNSTPVDLTVSITSPPVFTITGPTEMCQGETIELSSSSPSDNTWSLGGATTQNLSINAVGTYILSVNTSSCGIQTLSHTVTLKPDPTITSVDQTDVTCFGDTDGTITINSAESNLEYSINGTDFVTSNHFNSLIPGNYPLWVRQFAGCTIELEPISINEPEEVIAQSENTGAYCAGEQIFLQGTSPTSGIVTYNWTGPNGFVSSEQNPSNATIQGEYILTTSQNGCSSQTSSTIVDVLTLPIALASNTGPYCEGDVIQLEGATFSNSENAVFNWTGPNGFISSEKDPSGNLSIGLYQLTVSEDGCVSATNTSTEVIIHEIPTANASYVTPFCPGTLLQLNGNAVSTATTIAYQWSGPNGFSSTQQNPTNGTEIGGYNLIVSANGCSSDPFMVNVVPDTPTLNVTNSGPYCDGESIQLFGETTTNGPTSWSWVGPNDFSSTEQNPSTAISSGEYVLTINSNNCVSTASTNVVIHTTPTAYFSATTPCLNDASIFSTQGSFVESPETITDWNWNFGDGNSIHQNNPSHSFLTSGDFTVTLEVVTAHNCSATYSSIVSIIEPPIADFTQPSETPSTLNPIIQFTNLSQNAISYNWDFGSMSSNSSEHSPVFNYPETESSYTVTLVAYNEAGCSDTAIMNLLIKEEVLYYIPNSFTPDGDEYNQYFIPEIASGIDVSNYVFTIYNRWGELVFESRDLSIGWDGTYKGQVVPSGMYTWNLQLKHKYTDKHENKVGHLSLLR